MAKNKIKSISFEESSKKLERIVEQLENGNVDLDKAIQLYEDGIELVNSSIEILKRAELKIKTLNIKSTNKKSNHKNE
ncbi:MAG: exodeoxyribonuclease VII small subunit [Bacteroidetes bacterium]|nr:exodeoxyribonuclease VII small subunit [Bacteroidota bacterium]